MLPSRNLGRPSPTSDRAWRCQRRLFLLHGAEDAKGAHAKRLVWQDNLEYELAFPVPLRDPALLNELT